MVIGRTPEATYWEFFRADRAKDARAWAAVMSYPHVRIAAPGRLEYFESAEEFEVATTWTEREATGWVRTEGIEPKVIQTSSKKCHIGGGWIRYNAQDQPILTNRVVYVLTKLNDRWGVQARFACGATQAWQDIVDREPEDVAYRFLRDLRDGDLAACAGLVRYPYVEVDFDSIQRIECEDAFIETLPGSNVLVTSEFDITTIQHGPDGANVAVCFRGRDEAPHYAVFLIAKARDGCRIAAISEIGDSFFPRSHGTRLHS